MATAKKLPSGSWRCLAYSHTTRIYDEKKGEWKNKRIYESFTSDDPSLVGRREAEAAAALFQLNKDKMLSKQKTEYKNMTLTEAIDAYIETRTAVRSPTTIQDYKCIQKYAFRDIMQIKLKDLDDITLSAAVNREAGRISNKKAKNPKPISAKRLKNEWGLITAVLGIYCKDLEYNITLPEIVDRIPELLTAKTVMDMVRGTDIELPVLLASWLSFSMSEIRGLTKSKSISGNHLTIREVVVTVDNKPHRKEVGKNSYRNRRHKIPAYIKQLIDQVDGDVLVPMQGHAIYNKWIRMQQRNDIESPMTFHDLRHLNASVMALLRIPDKYAQERGGWKSDKVMKKVYMQTFSEERVKVDTVIDSYFEQIVNPDNGEIDKNKYRAWLTLFELDDNKESEKEFLKFMQHKMQHGNEKG